MAYRRAVGFVAVVFTLHLAAACAGEASPSSSPPTGPPPAPSTSTTVAVATTVGAAKFKSIPLLIVGAPSARAGDSATVRGSYFFAAPRVVLRWNATTGPVLAEIQPDGSGKLSATVVVPNDPPGRYRIFAVQRDAAGV